MPTSIEFLVIPHIPPLRDDIEHNNSNGFFMVPGSSNQRVRQKVEFYLIKKVSKNIKVTRVKFCSPSPSSSSSSSHWMIFLTLIINGTPTEGEEEELLFYTKSNTTCYETPNGWRIKKYVPRRTREPRVANYDMYMHNFGIPNGLIIERSIALSRIRLDDQDSIHSESIEDRPAHRINEVWTSIDPHDNVDISAPVDGILVNEVRTSISPRNHVDISVPIDGILVHEVN